MTKVQHKSKQTKSTSHGKTIDMTSQTININSDYFQVTPEGKVTCQALSVTGENSFINLNDIFIVTPNGKLTIIDNGNPYDDRNFMISKDSGEGEYASMTYNALTFYDGYDYTDFGPRKNKFK